ncbi:MAG TPA: S41 family peptidase [Thermoanaerobaculia bacterium]|nr:S41 family peptidase [Thermoanaerobaculia bacterium]
MKRVAQAKNVAAARDPLGAATPLASFVAQAGALTRDERLRIVRQALILIGENYAHLPLKRAMHSIDPVQRLKLLQVTLESASDAEQPADVEFHRELTEIFMSLRDLHTNYLLPAPYSLMTAFLPFIVEDYFRDGRRRYVVSHVAQSFAHSTFGPGVEVLYWNGMPIERAVMQNGQRYAGSNREARHARGVETLTIRSLMLSPPPDEEWVIVGYETESGENAEIRFDWQVSPSIPSALDPNAAAHQRAASALGLDLENEIVRRMRAALFAPHVLDSGHKAAAGLGPLESRFPDVFTAKKVTTPSGTFGYLRIWTFSHWPPEEFVSELVRLIGALPQRGLIIDVRGNGGGVIMNGELILQTLTPRPIEPEPLQFLNTPLNLEICRRNGPQSNWTDLSAWQPSIAQALQTGAVFSAGFPITDPQQCNEIGQKYFGPVVLVTDALCYSTTDIFAAGFQDHDIGPILGTDGNTGAGGANVWEHHYFVSDILPDAVYQDLPGGAGMRISIRRTLRVGRHAGAPLEDLGVTPQHRHHLSRNDVLHDNQDLIRRAAALLADLPARSLTITMRGATVIADVEGITRVDVYVDDRPSHSIDVENGRVQFDVPHSGLLELRGFDAAKLVARYRTRMLISTE